LDQVNVPPGGWPPFYAEVRDLLLAEFGVPDRSDLAAVLTAEVALRPDRHRSFPARVELEHDVVGFHRAITGSASRDDPAPELRLIDLGPGSLTVADPDGISVDMIREPVIDGKRSWLGDNPFWWDLSWELDSPLARPLARAVPE
ncbi:MAG: hypothetical protein AAGK32_16560, partial [Actinomycetota bacterium]